MRKYIFLSTSLNRERKKRTSEDPDLPSGAQFVVGFHEQGQGSKTCWTQRQGMKNWWWCFIGAAETCPLGSSTFLNFCHLRWNLSSQSTTTDQQGYFLRVAELTKLQPCCVVWGETPRTTSVRAPHFDLCRGLCVCVCGGGPPSSYKPVIAKCLNVDWVDCRIFGEHVLVLR